jgi:hypothetical protein
MNKDLDKIGTVASAVKCTQLSRLMLQQKLTFNPLTANDLQRLRAVSPLKIKIPSKICVKPQQIHQLFIQFINYVL